VVVLFHIYMCVCVCVCIPMCVVFPMNDLFQLICISLCVNYSNPVDVPFHYLFLLTLL
jgi:hypothetical protein